MKSFSATILSLFFTFSIIAQTSITGPYVSGNWYKIDSPFLIEGDITIHQDSSLTIEHGVEVVFQNEYSFTVDGTFEATGIFGDSILFTVQDTTGYASGTYTGWNGIRFYYPSDSSKLNYCIVEYSKVNGVYVEQSNLEVENSLVRNNTADGIYIVDGSGLDLHNSLIKNNKGDGLYIHYYSDLNSTNTATSNNINRGIYISSDCSVTLNNFYADYNGGAGVSITLLHGGSIFFDGGSISNNLDGGFYINNQSDNITLKNLIIEGNDKTGNGGGICVEGDEFIECGFTGIDLLLDNNSATSGAGIYSIYASIEIDSTTISNNDADLLSGWGGGIYTDLGDLALSNSSIFNCDAWRGGGIYIHNTWEYPGQIVELDSTVIEYCNADLGGGLYVLLEDAAMTIDRSQITNNNASNEGGGIYIGAAPASVGIINTTFYNNQAGTGGNALITYSPFLEPDLVNCIVWGHTEPAISSQGGAGLPSISYSDIQGTGIYPGTGNINQDPLFVDPNNGDFHLSWANPPYSWGGKSPCIDKGDPITPLDPDGTRTDMGAYYYHQTFTSISGNINDTLKCSESPYYVLGDLTVLVGENLVIEPCVHVVFMDDYRLNVEGRILAMGNISDNIYFYPSDTATGWQGIRFLNQNTNGQDSSKLEYCEIKYAKADGPGEDAKGGGVYCNNSSELLIKQCELSYNSAEKGGGIYCDSLSNPLISDNVLEYNQALSGGGIYGDSSSFQLEDCDIRYNTATDKGGGMYVRAAFSPLITDNDISGNTALSGGGIYGESSSFHLKNCGFSYNMVTDKGGGIACLENSVISLDNVNFNDNFTTTAEGIGAGIYCSESNLNLNAVDFEYNEASNSGGGIYCIESDVDMNEVVFYWNLCSGSGAGMYSKLSQMNLINVDFIVGSAGGNGGGLYCDSTDYQMSGGEVSGNNGGIYQRSGTASITNVAFNSNISYISPVYDGGGIYCTDANLSLTDVSFSSNWVLGSGGGIFSDGSILDLTRVTFSGCGNSQGGGGGAMTLLGSTCEMTDVNIFNNHVFYAGGGIDCSGSSITMYNVEISNNSVAYQSGGGIYSTSSDITIYNSKISNNTANGKSGGGIYCSSSDITLEKTLINNNYAVEPGGGVYLKSNSNMEFINTTIYSNSCYWPVYEGSAIYSESGSNANLLNSIIWQHQAPAFAGPGSITINYSDIEGGWPGTGNIDSDPLFVDPGNDDFNLSWINFPLNDITKSPCIDAGDPFSPKDPDSTRVDMGVYFYDQYYELDIKTFLEGPFFFSQMIPFLNIAQYIPLSQPYSILPWNYDGTESVLEIPNDDIIDWLLIELRDANSAENATGFTTFERQAVFLKKDGSVVELDGINFPRFYPTLTNDLYIVMKHRNHLGILSSASPVLNGRVYSYDFTDSDDKVYGAINAHKELNTNIWGMIAADGDANGQADNKDKNDIWYLQRFLSSYLQGDFDMDTDVDLMDIENLWKSNSGKSSFVPE